MGNPCQNHIIGGQREKKKLQLYWPAVGRMPPIQLAKKIMDVMPLTLPSGVGLGTPSMGGQPAPAQGTPSNLWRKPRVP